MDALILLLLCSLCCLLLINCCMTVTSWYASDQELNNEKVREIYAK
ncbi:hypothetical protein LI238_07600 [Longicatena sp. 210702-DFI.1.194]|nr:MULTISPECIES: hypothetical protein [Longicatena]MBS4975388.1 hypothetical protein [Eubacterium sp.]MCB6455620.1 hypothetical protein [Longicatena sp. 210702-DFI.1.253]MCB7252486.1 hypothetical protein [Longicatena sp. 210702-DFI.1.199]MCB7272131.1 hypothetical protein [Longicatena sp. 210702-DFI.1.163]MCB5392691.1 hypothetical protein [Longicatena caecimuris]